MSYSLKEVQKAVSMLLEYSLVDDVFFDMGTELIDGELIYNDTGERCRQLLIDFIKDASINR